MTTNPVEEPCNPVKRNSSLTWREKNPEKYREYQRKWHEQHSVEMKQYRQDHAVERREYAKTYYANHPKEIAEYQREYQAKRRAAAKAAKALNDASIANDDKQSDHSDSTASNSST